MIRHIKTDNKELRRKIKLRKICFGGNAQLKIYGRLNCIPGKRMKKENRVFFSSQKEATGKGFRPCGHCMRGEYKKWKDDLI